MTEDKSGRYSSATGATITGLVDRFKKRERAGTLHPDERLDGKTVLITGASSGLGLATAVHVARLGAKVLMVCRSGIPEKGEWVKERSGSGNVEMLHADLSDLNSIAALCDELKARGDKLDVLISNAAMVPARSRRSPQGLEEMFVVNYLSKFYFINRLLNQGQFSDASDGFPRIVIVSSESHRNPAGFEWEKFGVYEEYGMKDVVTRYSYFKLFLTTFAAELSRRLTAAEKGITVRSLCPGPVNSNIAREAPAWVRPILGVVFSLFFKSPDKASEPVIYHTARKHDTSMPFDYLFLMSRVSIDPKAADSQNGEKLWKLSNDLLASLGFPIDP